MKKNQPKSFAFVLMPFEDEFEDAYRLGIKAACEDCNIYCERVDEQIFQESILDRIYNQINKSDYVISDLSKRNVNVFYETGYAHAANKNVLLLTQDSDDIPFDLKHYPHIIYKNVSELKSKLKEKLEWFENEETDKELTEYTESVTPKYKGLKLENIEISIEKDIHDLNPANKLVASALSDSTIPIPISLENETPKLLNLGSYQFGLIYSHPLFQVNINTGENSSSELIKIDENSKMKLVQLNKKLFPKSWTKLNFEIGISGEKEITRKELRKSLEKPVPLKFRVFTLAGYSDFKFNLNVELSETQIF